jgi:AcrR family transcriptional regulator
MSWIQSIPFLAHLKRRDRDRLARYNIVIAILLAGWFPSILMLVVSYTILTNTLETKILHDRQTFVQLIAHLVGDDLSHTGSVIEYYQTQPDVAKILSGPAGSSGAQQWLTQTFYSHPRIDGMFITRADGQLIASLPAIDPASGREFSATPWREGAMGSPDVYVSPVHARLSDGRMATAIVGAVRMPDGNIAGYLGVWVLVERMGRRLSSIEIADQAVCQVVDQNGMPLFEKNFAPNTSPAPPQRAKINDEIRALKTGSIERDGTLYSFNTVDNTGWLTILEQPKAVAYKPVRDLLDKITIPALWLIGVTAAMAFYAARVARRQAEAARRIEREVIFNEKILANMPSGIALVDPESRHFLQANQTFIEMAKRFGELPEGRDIYEAVFDEVKIAVADQDVDSFWSLLPANFQPTTFSRKAYLMLNVPPDPAAPSATLTVMADYRGLRLRQFDGSGNQIGYGFSTNGAEQCLELILRTSARIFAEKSYHSTSMRDISRETGVSLAGLYHYCKSKEELLFLIQDHCFGRVLERLEERIRTTEDPLERFRIFVDNHLSFFAANMAEMKVLSHEAESLAGDLHEHVSTRKRQYTRTARRILSEVQQAAADSAGRSPRRTGQRGRLAKPIDLTMATYALFGMMNWIYNWYDPHGKLSVSQLVDNMTRLFLTGFLSQTTEPAALAGSGKAEKMSIWRTA